MSLHMLLSLMVLLSSCCVMLWCVRCVAVLLWLLGVADVDVDADVDAAVLLLMTVLQLM